MAIAVGSGTDEDDVDEPSAAVAVQPKFARQMSESSVVMLPS
jgi:hypothetical protein